jgi:hypothetical protein
MQGWDMLPVRGMSVEATCYEGGCFNSGWRETDFAGRPLADYFCRVPSRADQQQDCWIDGWTIHNAAGVSEVYCKNNDCRHSGWDIYSNGRRASIVCKNSDCFTQGWTLYQ